jgi:hypothetical protein
VSARTHAAARRLCCRNHSELETQAPDPFLTKPKRWFRRQGNQRLEIAIFGFHHQSPFGSVIDDFAVDGDGAVFVFAEFGAEGGDEVAALDGLEGSGDFRRGFGEVALAGGLAGGRANTGPARPSGWRSRVVQARETLKSAVAERSRGEFRALDRARIRG